MAFYNGKGSRISAAALKPLLKRFRELLEVSVQQSTNVLFQRFRIIEKSRVIKPIIKDYSFKLILSFCAFSYYV